MGKLLNNGSSSKKNAGVLQVFNASKTSIRRKRRQRVKALRMLSRKQSEVEPESESNKGESGSSMAGTSNTGDGTTSTGSCVNGEGSQEFLSTGRTGRRNALHDILGEHAETNIADLPDKFDALTTDSGGTSRSQSEAGPSQQPQQQAG